MDTKLNKNNSELRDMIACRTRVSTVTDDASQCLQRRKGMQSSLIWRWVFRDTSLKKGIRSINNSQPAMNTWSDSAVPTLQHQKQLTQHLSFPHLFRNYFFLETLKKKRRCFQYGASPLLLINTILYSGRIRLRVSAKNYMPPAGLITRITHYSYSVHFTVRMRLQVASKNCLSGYVISLCLSFFGIL
jgi:hypothetical protein